MIIFKVIYNSTGLKTTRLMVADSAISAFKMAEDCRLSNETIDKVEDFSGNLSVHVQMREVSDD